MVTRTRFLNSINAVPFLTRYGIWVGRMAASILGLVLGFAAVNLDLAFVIFLVCHNGFVQASFFRSLDRLYSSCI